MFKYQSTATEQNSVDKTQWNDANDFASIICLA